ncbi:MAG TPA: hypothetical protein VLF63_03100 [Patescibacteria group bacterium]|nr:hypothetical protein [Patescibacteria group bacterium]
MNELHERGRSREDHPDLKPQFIEDIRETALEACYDEELANRTFRSLVGHAFYKSILVESRNSSMYKEEIEDFGPLEVEYHPRHNPKHFSDDFYIKPQSMIDFYFWCAFNTLPGELPKPFSSSPDFESGQEQFELFQIHVETKLLS